jgi:hypothetical protein
MPERRWRVRDCGDDLLIELSEMTGRSSDATRPSWHMEELLRRDRSGAGEYATRDVLLDVHRVLFGDAVASWSAGNSLETIRNDLRAAARAGRVVVTRAPVKARLVMLEAAPEEPLGPESSTDVTDWIEIKLVDPDGKPVPNVGYAITAADGSTSRGTLDARGFARVEGLEAGSCIVSFPDIDAREYKEE